MEIRQLLQTVRANWLVALVTFLVCVGLGAAYAILPAKTYSASVVLLAQIPQNAADPSALVGAIQIEIPQITVEAESPTIDEEARALVPQQYQGAAGRHLGHGRPHHELRDHHGHEHEPAGGAGVRQRHRGPGDQGDEP